MIDKGAAHFPYEWAPNRVDVQMLRVGNFGKWFSWSPALPTKQTDHISFTPLLDDLSTLALPLYLRRTLTVPPGW